MLPRIGRPSARASGTGISSPDGVRGMEITYKQKAGLQPIAAQFLLGIAGLALVTFVCFQLGFGLARAAFAYLIVIALVSLVGSFSVSVVLSIVAIACLDY